MLSISSPLRVAAIVALAVPSLCSAQFAIQPITASSLIANSIVDGSIASDAPSDTANTLAVLDFTEPAPSAITSAIFFEPAAPLVKTTSTAPAPPSAARWLDLTAFSHSERYRNQYGNDGYHYFENGQERSLISGKFKLDAGNKYAIGFRASTGRTFNWSYADFAGPGFTYSLNNPAHFNKFLDGSLPALQQAVQSDPAGVAFVKGIQSAGWEFYLRELYFSATPIKTVTFEFGSFGIEKGLSTEITSFDEDGYIQGERVRINDHKHFFFDQISLTSAYFGYLDQPNIFVRGPGFSKSNYRQVAGKKQLTKRIGISGEYNWISNSVRTNTTREAIIVGIPETKILDKFRLEGYEMNSHVFLQGNENVARQGFALVGEKKIGKLSGDFGFASIDREYGLFGGSNFAQQIGFSLNGDSYNTGIRIFTHASYKITPVITALGFYTHFTGRLENNAQTDYLSNINWQGLNGGLSFDLKALVNSKRKVL